MRLGRIPAGSSYGTAHRSHLSAVISLGFPVVNVSDRQDELVIMFVGPAAIFRAPVSHDPQHWQFMLIMERQHPVIEQISGSDGRFGSVELGMGNLAIGVHIGLLIHPTDALERADIKGVL